jgi:hypothetical protein
MAPLLYQPTSKTAIGVFESNGSDDIFQIVGPGGAVQSHMLANGYMDPATSLSTSAVTLSSAQLKALHTTPVQLVAAPGANLAIIPVQFALVFNYVAPQYSNTGSDGSIYFGWGSTVAAVTTNYAIQPSYAMIEAASSQISTDAFSVSAQALANVVNQPLSLAMLDTFTTGNGTLKVGIAYYTVSIL